MLFLESYIRWSHMTREHLRIVRKRPEFRVDRFLQIITEYYDKYGVVEEEQYVPAIVIGDRYLFAGEEIIGQLMEALVAGEGLKTPLLDGNERAAK